MHRDISGLCCACCVPPVGSCYIVGSDQVWPETNLLPLNFLSFAPEGSKKISYAASLGKSEISNEYLHEYRKGLADFSAVSLRESCAVNAIRSVYNGNVETHVDPTLLYDRTIWEEYEIPYTGRLPEKYLLVYVIYTPPGFNNRLKEIKKQTGLPIVLVANTPHRKCYADIHIRDAGPAEFIWLMHYAEGIIASSYHGTIFSILFGKPFIPVVNPDKTARFDSLLSLLGLSKMVEWDTDFLSRAYDITSINSILERERNRSREYLERWAGNGSASY